LLQAAAQGYDPIITTVAERNYVGWQNGGFCVGYAQFSPSGGTVGTPVTVTGTGLSTVTGVRFNNTDAMFTLNSDSVLFTSVPPGARIGRLRLYTPSGPALLDTFVVAPRVTGFVPPTVPAGGSVRILGVNFTRATAVRINDESTSFTVISDTLITALVPEDATTGPVTVVNPGGEGTSDQSLVVAEPTSVPSTEGEGLRLEPARSNPASESVRWGLNLPRPMRVNAIVLDAAGKRVRVLVEEDHAAGRHELVWDRRDDRGHAVAAGAYFLRVAAGGRLLTQRVTVLQ